MRLDNVDVGINIGLDYARGFLIGAANAATMTSHPFVAAAFRSAADELSTVTPAMVRAGK